MPGAVPIEVTLSLEMPSKARARLRFQRLAGGLKAAALTAARPPPSLALSLIGTHLLAPQSPRVPTRPPHSR